MSHPLQPNHKPKAQWTDIPKMTLRSKSEGGSDICQTTTSEMPPTPLMWNLREDPTEELPAAKQMQAYHSNLPASCPDSSNVGSLVLMHGGLLSFKNSMQTDIPNSQ